MLSEFTRSATAIRHGIDNTPDADSVAALQDLCINVLEPLRRRFGVIRITSGYRCLKLNQMVGGSRTSQHLFGEAADIHVGSLETARKYFYFIKDHLLFDQMLLEMKGREGILPARQLHLGAHQQKACQFTLFHGLTMTNNTHYFIN